MERPSSPTFVHGTDEQLPAELSSHDRILQAARRLFATDGYENATTSAIARKAGTSESQLIKHFGSKEGLLEAIFDQSWQRMGAGIGQVLERYASPREKLQALTELLISALETDKELRTLMLLEGRRIRRHGHMVLLTRGFLQLLGAVDALLRELREAGELRQDLNVEAVRSALVGSFEGLLRDQLLAERANFPAHYDGSELRAAFRIVLDCFFMPAEGR
ncbi:MAG TPA: TetR/AcrR family transcriptional regulator [Thermoanaerobaculia bacterium]|nr:TetR/AcrR family transcriptional regulator [Thermoanaerobaculia bacterium]